MLMKLRIIFLLPIGLSSYGSTFIALPRFSEGGSVSLSPHNNNVEEIESRLIPIPFGSFGLFRNKQRVKTDVATLQTQVAKLNADVALLNRQVARLTQFQRRTNATIQNLKSHGVNTTTLLNALETLNGSSSSNQRGRCPTVAANRGGKVIGNFCYFVGINPILFNNARIECLVMAGNLAEPLADKANSQRLYNNLRRNFPAQFRIIDGANLWIGYEQTATAVDGDFIGLTTSRHVQISADIFNGAPEAGTVQEGAAIINTGFWAISSIVDTTLPYICQFFLI